MADASLNALAQPSVLGSDEGNVWMTAQYCYHAEVQADRGSQPGAHDQLDRAHTQLEKITDAAAHDTATGYYNAAVDYVNARGGQDQASLQTVAQVQDNSVTQGNTLTPDQQAALEADNNAWAFAKSAQESGGNPDLAYLEAKGGQAVDEAVKQVTKATEGIGTTLKFGALGIGAALVIILVIVVLVKS